MKTRGLRVGYRGQSVCEIPDLDFEPGRVWLITGSNGSGKTTLLKTLAGLLPAVGGMIDPQPKAGPGGVVFVHSSPVLFRGSLRHNLHVANHDSSAIERIASEFALQDRLDQSAAELSHGMRQRAALARAVLAQPATLLLDEPEGGLDQSALSIWQSFAAKTVNERRMTLIVAAHRPAGLEGLAVTEIKLGVSPG